MNKFAETTNENLQSFFKIITDARTKLENCNFENPDNDLIQIITDIQEIDKNIKNWSEDLLRYKNCKNILEKQKYRFPNNFIDMDKVENEWSKLKQILEKKSRLMEDQLPTLEARVKADESRLNEKIKKLENFWSEKNPEKADTPSEALKIISEANNQLLNVKDDYIRNCKAKELLNMDLTDQNRLNPIEENIANFREVWSALNNIYSKVEVNKDTLFVAVNPDKIKKDIEEAINELSVLPGKYRTYEATEIVTKRLNQMKKENNIISDLRTEAIKPDRHWPQILKLLQIKKNYNELILDDFWKCGLEKKNKKLYEIINQATGELVL
jgi:dynein heavy chain 1